MFITKGTGVLQKRTGEVHFHRTGFTVASFTAEPGASGVTRARVPDLTDQWKTRAGLQDIGSIAFPPRTPPRIKIQQNTDLAPKSTLLPIRNPWVSPYLSPSLPEEICHQETWQEVKTYPHHLYSYPGGVILSFRALEKSVSARYPVVKRRKAIGVGLGKSF